VFLVLNVSWGSATRWRIHSGHMGVVEACPFAIEFYVAHIMAWITWPELQGPGMLYDTTQAIFIAGDL
jgi:hypothetical protein